MSIPNQINATLAPEDTTAIAGKIDEAKALLPFLQDLDNSERQSLPKIGDKSRSFVSRCLESARQDDSFLPRNLDTEAFAKDLALHEALEPIRARLAKLLELVEDTQTLAGSEA